jgi:tetratricopeptide (TPR) repeat protein
VIKRMRVSLSAGSIKVFVGGRPEDREAAVAETLRNNTEVHDTTPSAWPFSRAVVPNVPSDDAIVVRAPRLHDAFPAGQTAGTRLVLTQSSYQLQRWIDWLDAHHNAAFVGDADAHVLRRVASEAFQRRGPWHRVELVDLADVADVAPEPNPSRANTDDDLLQRAFTTEDPGERLALCRRALAEGRDDAVAWLAVGSAYMEVQDLDACKAAIDRAIALAPDWEAAHYEQGKLFLRFDDLEAASRAFAEAGRLMPSLSAAFGNLGATLGELDRPNEALQAFQQALKYDPNGYTVVNNIGVVSRELGRLAESEAAFRKVVAAAPEFVFGHYNLGHTLFLQGRYQAALSAYVEGQRRDPEKNPRQACRLAVVRLAAGDTDGSLRDLQRVAATTAGDQRREIFTEAQEILWALLTDQPALAGWRQVADVVRAQING